MKTLDYLRLEMPAVFELREQLMSQIAEETAKLRLESDRLDYYARNSETSAETIDRKRREGLARYHACCQPIRQELDRITRKIVSILAMQPPAPIQYDGGGTKRHIVLPSSAP